MSSQIPKVAHLTDRILKVRNREEFDGVAHEVFHFQYRHNPVYQRYCDLIHCVPTEVMSADDIPFLPISFFKTHEVTSGKFAPGAVFESSGTTGSVNARHLVKDTGFYDRSCVTAFSKRYGAPDQYCFLALLPSYLERKASSLVHMVQVFMNLGGHPMNGFYLHDHERLSQTLRVLEDAGQRTMLIGVTYALLDFAASFPQTLRHTTVMETGGMKGRKKELVRTEVHAMLGEAFGLGEIHSEYGMTELLSQAYAPKEGKFECPPWMRVVLREEDDRRAIVSRPERLRTGGINVIDLANLHSCSFIATDDIGRLHPDGLFEVLGRLDHSDVRGCSLLAV